MKKFWTFIFAIFVSFIPGIIGGFFSPMTPGVNAWYNGLTQSVLTPNGWVFSIAWIILYTLLGIALYLIMRKDNGRKNQSKTAAYGMFVAQMVLNAMWSFVFFGLHAVGWALVCLIALIVVAIWMASEFKPISRTASYLVWPYIAWLIYALYLNSAIFVLN